MAAKQIWQLFGLLYHNLVIRHREELPRHPIYEIVHIPSFGSWFEERSGKLLASTSAESRPFGMFFATLPFKASLSSSPSLCTEDDLRMEVGSDLCFLNRDDLSAEVTDLTSEAELGEDELEASPGVTWM